MNQRDDNVLAFTWYREEEYEKLLEVTSEPEGLKEDYQAWLADARQALLKYKRMGFEPRRVYLEVDDYVDWCRLRDKPLNEQSREMYKEIQRQAFYRRLDSKE